MDFSVSEGGFGKWQNVKEELATLGRSVINEAALFSLLAGRWLVPGASNRIL